MTDRVDWLVAMLTARLCVSPECSGDVSCEDCQDVAREALHDLATIAREVERLQAERDWLARKCEWLESQTVNAQKAHTWDSAEQYIAAAREAVTP